MTREEAIKILEQRFDASCRNNLFQNAEKLDYEDALWMAISALRSTPQPGKPLTLEQLREMDGQPVWIVEYPDWGHWELSEDANDYIVDRNLDFYGMKHDDPDGRYGFHKLGWLAYPYPPAHIDRSEWEGCRKCRSCWTCKSAIEPVRAENSKCFLCEDLSNYEPLNFCSHCGRPLTEEAWVELERRVKG